MAHGAVADAGLVNGFAVGDKPLITGREAHSRWLQGPDGLVLVKRGMESESWFLRAGFAREVVAAAHMM